MKTIITIKVEASPEAMSGNYHADMRVVEAMTDLITNHYYRYFKIVHEGLEYVEETNS